jgi:SacI homology domain
MQAPPRALRVATLCNSLVLHDTSSSLRGTDPAARNALIDAANAADASRRASLARAPSHLATKTPPPASLVDVSLSPPSPRRPRDDDATQAQRNQQQKQSPRTRRDRYLVIPFPTRTSSGTTQREPFETHDPAEAGIDDAGQHTAPVDAAAGFLGILRLQDAAYAVIVSQIRRAGSLPSGPVMHVHRVKLLKLGHGQPSKEDREFGSAVSKLLESGTLYYSLDCDLTRSLDKVAGSPGTRVGNAFWWTWPMARLGGQSASSWSLRTVYGFVGTQALRFASNEISGGQFNLTLVSRRSRRRAGTRYITRGVDALGDVANFVETEQVVWTESCPEVYSAFVVIRGSVPVFWRQTNGIARPSPELDSTLPASRAAFSAHFRNMARSYGGVTAISLVDMHGSEALLADAFERHMGLDIAGSFDGLVAPKLVAFDFHAHCGGKEYERGLASLLSRIRSDIYDFGFFTTGVDAPDIPRRQRGVFRVNCVDCLDRTNVVQSMLARVALDLQLAAILCPDFAQSPAFGDQSRQNASPRIHAGSEDRFKHVWGDNGDAVSKQYSGTGAMKTDFTRTGKRSTTGIMGDGVKSVVRMYYKNFVDEGRQEAIDILCGNANVRPRDVVDLTSVGGEAARNDDGRTAAETVDSDMDHGGEDSAENRDDSSGLVIKDSPLWYSFNALRMNAGGDRQTVIVELRDAVMQLATPEGVNFEYPRRGLATWDLCEDGKSGDRRHPSRLRLVHLPSTGAPAAASPLDLLFRAGPTAREKFLRAYLSWAEPPAIESIGGPVRIRVLSARGVGKHCMADWGLDTAQPKHSNDALSTCEGRELVALVVPEGHSGTRLWGLAAVPIDVDDSEYDLLCAQAVSNRGPAIAILASKAAAKSVMSVTDATVGRAGSLTGGGAVGVSLVVSGTSVCFVSARLGGPKDLYRVLSSLKLRRAMFDVTNQFEHFYIAGVMGDLLWRTGDTPAIGPEARQFLKLGDGSTAYSLGNGLSVLRNSFPTLRVANLLNKESFWRQTNHDSDSVDARADSTRSGNDERPALTVAMIDEIVPGGVAPVLPNKLSRCIVTLSSLRGEGIKMPPGIDQNTPLNTFFAVYSDYVGSDPVVTRPTPRSTDQPEWREAIQLSLVPSDVDDVKRGFLLCQVLIPTPLAEPIPAGHCVLPISYAGETGCADFDIPLRLAGIATGRVCGVIELQVSSMDNSSPLGDSSDELFPKSSTMGRHASSAAGQLQADQFQYSQQQGLSTAGDMPRSQSALDDGFGNPVPLQQRPNLDDINDKLDIARRKGSKQIKSMVGKLSSLLGQAGGSGGGGSGSGGSIGIDFGIGSGVGVSGNSLYPPPMPGLRTDSLVDGYSDGRLPGSSASSTDLARHLTDVGNISKPLSAAAQNPLAPETNSRCLQPSSLPDTPSLHASRTNSGASCHAPTGGVDPLLAGLSKQASTGDPLLKSLAYGRPRIADKSALLGEDDLLAGLSKITINGRDLERSPQEVRSGDGEGRSDEEDDDWGTFEAAAPERKSPHNKPFPSSHLLDM